MSEIRRPDKSRAWREYRPSLYDKIRDVLMPHPTYSWEISDYNDPVYQATGGTRQLAKPIARLGDAFLSAAGGSAWDRPSSEMQLGSKIADKFENEYNKEAAATIPYVLPFASTVTPLLEGELPGVLDVTDFIPGATGIGSLIQGAAGVGSAYLPPIIEKFKSDDESKPDEQLMWELYRP